MYTISLNKSHREYINSIFSQSSILGKNLLKYGEKIGTYARITLEKGFVFNQSFEFGGVADKNMSISILARELYLLISKHNFYIVLYNSCALRSDQIVEQYSWPIFCGNDVYHIISSHASVADIRRSIIETETGFALLGVVVPSVSFNVLPDHTSVDKKQIEIWADISEYIIVGVCDGEAYLLCNKNN